MNIVSLFDGMSCGQIALNELGYKIDNYYASEIEDSAVKVTKHNFPSTVHLGDVTKLDYKDGLLSSVNGNFKLDSVDLLIGGSPCQDLSFANSSRLNLEGDRSSLVFKFYEMLLKLKPKYFLLENVKMNKESMDTISKLLGVQPIEINSNLVSAQNRKRLYWTNIPDITQPKDNHTLINDILDHENFETFQSPRIEVSKVKTKNYFKWDISGKGYYSQQDRAYFKDGKMCCIPKTSVKSKLNIVEDEEKGIYRRITVNECERLQNVPVGYTDVMGVSKTKRYEMLGNGWTVGVIKHIFKNI